MGDSLKNHGALSSRCSVPGSLKGGIVLDEEAPASSSSPFLSSVPCKTQVRDDGPCCIIPSGSAISDVPSSKMIDSLKNLFPSSSRSSVAGSSKGDLVSKKEINFSSSGSSPFTSSEISDHKVSTPVAGAESLAPAVRTSCSDVGVERSASVFGPILPGVSSIPHSSSAILQAKQSILPPLLQAIQSSSLYPVLSSHSGQSDGPLSASVVASAVPEHSLKQASSNFESDDPNFPPLASSIKVSGATPCFSPSQQSKSCLPGGVPDAERKAHPTWASLVKEDPARLQLKFLKPDSYSDDGKLRIKLPPSVALKGVAAWKNTLVGFFLDRLPFSLVQACAQRLWGKIGLTDVLSNGNGFFFFKFSESGRLNDVLEGGPWYFGGRPIFLKLWSPGMNLSKEGCKQVPIWAHFYNIPLEYWTDEGLSYIASAVGKPLHADILTSSLKRLSFARICIEIGIEDTLPNALDIELEDGSCLDIRIEYNWVPKKCSVCSAFGHLTKNCFKVKRQVWIPKSSIPPILPPSDGDWKTVKAQGIDMTRKLSPASKLQHSLPSIASSHGFLKHVHSHGKEDGLFCSTNSFDSLPSEDFPTVAVDPTAAVDDPFRSGVGVPTPVDDPIGGSGDPMAVHDPIGTVAGDPIAVVDPSGTGAVDDPIFDDPNAFATVATVPLASSVSLVEDSSRSALSPPCIGCEDSSPSSSPSSTPLLARRLNLIDEVERKLGRKKKDKKKNGSSGNSRGKLSMISK